MVSFPSQQAARLLYSKVNLGEMSSDLKMGGKQNRRKKTDKDSSWGQSKETEETDEDFDEERQTKRTRRKNAFWKIGTAGFAAATIGTNIYSYLTFGGITQMMACGLASFISSFVAVRECTMLDVNGE
jgi:hypothetical protein